MKNLTELTDAELLEIYNQNFGEEFENISQLDIERSPYGTIEVHKKGGYDDMMLTMSKHGAIYLLCLDNNEIYHDVIGALTWLKNNKIEPFI
jgi:hypothetical protein